MNKLKQMTLLYAEDELITQALYKRHFENHFKSVYTARNGHQALEIYNTIKPNVVILDINMPLINGLEVSRRIRKHDHQTRIILLTSRVDKEAFLEAVELDLTTYIEKPVTKEHLIHSLNKLLDNNEIDSIRLWRHNNQNYYWNFLKRELFCDLESIHMTKNEKCLLELLIKSKHEKVTYQQIYEAVWYQENHKEYSEGSIKTMINALRSKLPPKVVQNVYGLGYILHKS